MTEKDAERIAEAMIEGVRGYFRRSIATVIERLGALEQRFSALPTPQPGPQGEKGDAGEPGARGADGEPGARGEKGDQGEPGPAGKDGEPGARGEVGPAGPRGEQGPAGEPGAAGARGEKGDKGDPGEPGPAGKDGAPGLNGKDGADGRDGNDGTPGPRGEKGDPGQDGRDGREGEPGRDAAQIDVLPTIDHGKRYARGTFAAYRGGLVRSFRATEPLPDGEDLEKHGWHVVARGIDEIALELGSDGRTVGLALRMTDGATVVKSVRVPTLIDRGIFKAEGMAYDAGDVVTWDGSLWAARRSVLPGEKPGDDSGAFRMIVKRGRDGRDGLRGEKGERGAEGKSVVLR